MSGSDVERLMGKPSTIYWRYPKELTVAFDAGKVVQIHYGEVTDAPVDIGMAPAEVEALLGQSPSTWYVFRLPNWRRAIIELNGARVVRKWFDEVKPSLPPGGHGFFGGGG